MFFQKRFFFLFFTILLLLLHHPVQADEPEIELIRSGKVVYIGDEYRFQMKVDGVDQKAKLLLPEAKDLTIRQLGRPSMTSQTVIINGSMESFSGLVYNIGIQPHTKGMFQVPPLTIEWEGKSYQTRGFELKAVEPGQQDSMAIKLKTLQREIYLGEALEFEIRWFIKEDLNDYELRFPLMRKAKELQLQVIPPEQGTQQSNLLINGVNLPFYKNSQLYEGEEATLFSTKLRVIPGRSGEFELPAISAKGKVQRGASVKTDVFGRPVRVPGYESVFAVSRSLKIQVKPLPSKGVPAGFTGGVGKFKILVTPDAERVKVGDPIILTIEIIGEGNLQKTERPILSDIPAFKKSFQITESIDPGEIKGKSKVFTQTIRALNTNVQLIPSVEFGYFNPESKQYETAASPPVKIRVLKAEALKDEDIFVGKTDVTSSKKDMPTPPVFNVKEGYRELLGQEELMDDGFGAFYWLAVLCLPPIGLGILILLRNGRSEVTPEVRKNSTRSLDKDWNKSIIELESTMEGDSRAFLESAERILKQYFLKRLTGANYTGELTTEEIQKLAEAYQVNNRIVEELTHLIERLHAGIYGGIGNTAESRRHLIYQMKEWRQAWN